MIDILAELAIDNPKVPAVTLQMYADALRSYVEASKNIEANGSVCSHPRTGAPIDNPYLRVRDQQGAVLRKMRAIKGDRVLKRLLED
jgi:hypothetical protein